MRGGIKTAAWKDWAIPIAEKILPLVEFFYAANEYLLNVNGKPLLNVGTLRRRVWNKTPLPANHLPGAR